MLRFCFSIEVVSMRWSGVLKFVLGVFIAIALLATGAFIASKIVIARFVVAPPKPVFPNDNKPIAPPPKSTAAAKAQPDADKPAATPKPLPSGAFQARVTQSIGLIVRDSPSLEGASVGGVDFNERVTVLATSPDGVWQKIRMGSDREGWVKAGNLEQLNP
jgi:uncharacterized protein YgiM (DUF1202 family)